MTDGRDYRRLATFVRDRRKELRLSHAKIRSLGGPSQATMFKIERGDSIEPTDETKTKLERVLGWTPNSVDQVLAGGEPTLALPAGTEGRAEVLHEEPGERIIIDIVTGLGELTDDDRREILALIKAKQQRRNG